MKYAEALTQAKTILSALTNQLMCNVTGITGSMTLLEKRAFIENFVMFSPLENNADVIQDKSPEASEARNRVLCAMQTILLIDRNSEIDQNWICSFTRIQLFWACLHPDLDHPNLQSDRVGTLMARDKQESNFDGIPL